MTKDKKNTFWREKITVEISLVHVQSIAREMRTTISGAEVGEFLNQSSVAQRLWIHMMQAGERYIKSSLESRVLDLPQQARVKPEVRMIQWRQPPL